MNQRRSGSMTWESRIRGESGGRRARLLAGLLAGLAAGLAAAPTRAADDDRAGSAGSAPSAAPAHAGEDTPAAAPDAEPRAPRFFRGLKERDFSLGYGFKIPL